jgi:hypothetical protein
MSEEREKLKKLLKLFLERALKLETEGEKTSELPLTSPLWKTPYRG